MSAPHDSNGHAHTPKRRTGVLALFVGVFAAGFVIPSLVYAAPRTFAQLADLIISLVNPLAALLTSIAVLFFFYNVLRYIASGGTESKTKHKDNIVWGIVALFVIVSVWGLARLVSNVFLGGNAQQPARSTGEWTTQMSETSKQPGCGPSCI